MGTADIRSTVFIHFANLCTLSKISYFPVVFSVI